MKKLLLLQISRKTLCQHHKPTDGMTRWCGWSGFLESYAEENTFLKKLSQIYLQTKSTPTAPSGLQTPFNIINKQSR